MKHRTARRALIAAAAGVVTFAMVASAAPPWTYQPTPQAIFSPIVVPHDDFAVAAATASPAPSVSPALATLVPRPPRPAAPRPRPRVELRTAPRQPASSHYLRGRASWYCKAGVSVCHHSYPDRAGVVDLYAAACSKLRSAMGSWRGKVVTVKASTGRIVRVRLIDYCASTDKSIDLYYDAMRALGGSGVLHVTITW